MTTDDMIEEIEDLEPALPRALVVLEQRVRPDARDTLEYFADQNVSVKVISGRRTVPRASTVKV